MPLQILRNIGTLIVLVFIGLIIIKILYPLIGDKVKKASKNSLSVVGNTMLKIHNKNIQKAAMTDKKTFASGKLYKDISQVIFDLGYDDVTVEGFLFCLFLFSVVVGFIVLFFSKSIVMFIAVTIGTFILMYTVAYMSATAGHFTREFAIMDAIDIIIVNMENGVFKAVKEQLDLFDESVREDFRLFLDDVYEYKIPIEEALDILGDRLGPGFTRFKEKAKEYESKGRAGMLETFADDMNENTYRRMDLRELLDALQEANMGFAMAMGVCGMLASTLIGSSEQIREFLLTTTIGHIAILINIFAIIFSFAYLQSLRRDKKGGEQ